MKYVDYLRFWIDVLAHPGKATKRALGVKAALKLYYLLSIIPLVLGLVVVYAVGGFNPFSTSSPGMFGFVYPAQSAYRLAAGVGYILLLFLVIIPLDILINSGIYHLLMGKLFKFYNKDYAKVFTAALYGVLPALLVYWLYPAGLLGLVIIGIFGLWGFIVEIIAFSNQLGMSRFKAFCTFLLYVAIVAVIAFVFGVLTSLAAL